MTHRFIFLFLDGVGLGAGGAANPLTPYQPDGGQSVQPMPYLAGRLGGPLLAGLEIDRPGLLLKPVDVQLGVAGRPQSATGQAALYTGRNAPAYLGRHLTGFANGSLRTLLEESGMFRQVLELGLQATSANLYTEGYFEAIEQRRLRWSVGALLSLTAGVPFRMPGDYERGEALFWDITNRYARERDITLPRLSPTEAGERLARLGATHHLTLFECYLPDFAGHRQDMAVAREVLRDIDGLIEGLLENLAPDVTLVISSDHGNIEHLESKLHTLNPVPLLVFGPAASAFSPVENITGLTPTIIRQLSSPAGPEL